MLKEIKIIKESPLGEPLFLKPGSITYTVDDGEEAYWEMIKQHNSVHILVNNITTNELLFVKQVRIPVLVNNPETDGTVIECCAGIVDKNISLAEIAIDEVREELGYDVDILSVQHVRTLKSSVGSAGSTGTAFYVEVEDCQYIGQQLSLFEDIEVIRVPYEDVEEITENATTDAMTLFLTYWWLAQNN